MMFSNLRSGLKICRPCATTSTRFLIRASNSHFETSTISSRISRAFSSIDVASLIGEPSKVPERSSVRKKAVSGQEVRPVPSAAIPHWVKTPIDLSILKAQNSDDLWNVALKYELTDAQAVAFLANLAKFAVSEGGIDFKKISASSRKPAFDAVVRALSQQSGALTIGDSVLVLRSLLALDVPAEDELVAQLRTTLLKDFFLLSQSTLISFAVFHAKYAEASELGKGLQTAIEQSLLKRIKEVTDPNDALTVFAMVKRQDPIAYKAAEAYLLELIPSFNGEQLARLLNILSSKRVRSLPLLKSIANYYVHCEDDLTIKRLAGILSDLAVLHYPNLKILTVLFRDIEAKVQTITKPAVAVGVFSSLAIMRLRCEEFLEALCHWTRKHLDAFTAEEVASVLVALARCNYAPTERESADLITDISKRISRKKFEQEKQLWLDTVWALAILGRLSQEHAASVLDRPFYEEVLKDLGGNDYKHLVTQLKLRNINAAARLELDGYKGPFLNFDALKVVKQVDVVHYKEESVKLLTDALNNLAPRDKYMKTNVTLPEGYIVDALLRMTADGKPLPVSQWAKAPPDSWPVAVILRHFNDTTQISDSPIGLNAMAARHLNALHYVVLEIPATEIEQRRQSLARVHFLKEKLAIAVHNAMTAHGH